MRVRTWSESASWRFTYTGRNSPAASFTVVLSAVSAATRTCSPFSPPQEEVHKSALADTRGPLENHEPLGLQDPENPLQVLSPSLEMLERLNLEQLRVIEPRWKERPQHRSLEPRRQDPRQVRSLLQLTHDSPATLGQRFQYRCFVRKNAV